MVISEAGPEDTTAEESSDRALLEAIPQDGGISASKLCSVLVRGKGVVLRDLARLAARGKVRQVGMGKASRWVHA
jgi:predicted HTH transcriptional regulator